jgi:uncharacterized membrane protein YdbT with pleckstrin-like domain
MRQRRQRQRQDAPPGRATGRAPRLLAEGERVALAVRPHWKRTVGPALVLLTVSPVTAFLLAVVPQGRGQAAVRTAVILVALGVLLGGCLVPFLRWLTTAYVLTTRRLVTRQGILTRWGRDVPLSRIHDVSFVQHRVQDRLLGCGTLAVESAAERGRLVLTDVPRVHDVHRELFRLIDAAHDRAWDRTSDPPARSDNRSHG